MVSSRRIDQQPAFLLHHRPFRDTSQILEFVTRDHGKIAVVARGSRGAKSRLAGVLRAFQPLRISWAMRSDLGTLTGAEPGGAPVALGGDALLSAYYINELLLNFLHRHDAQPEIFSLYEETIPMLGAANDVATVLRGFELDLLGLLGYAPNFEHATREQDGLEPDAFFDYRAEQGPVPVERSEGALVFSGRVLTGIRDRRFDDPEVLKAAGRLLRAIVTYHLGGKELKTRKVLLELHRGRIARPDQRIPANE